jgi:hypothetical protein
MISVSSTAVVLKMLSGAGMTQKLASRVMIGLLVVQDLAVVPMLVKRGRSPVWQPRQGNRRRHRPAGRDRDPGHLAVAETAAVGIGVGLQ